MVTADGKEWAARLDDGSLAASTLTHDKCTFEQWQERLANQELVDVRDLLPDVTQLRCDDTGCVYRKDSHVPAIPIIKSAALGGCEHSDIIVAPFLIKDCAAATVIDNPE